jgi:hypothetical protein
VFNSTFSNISAVSWRPVLVVEEAGENHGKSIIIHQVINTEETKMWWEKIVNKNSNANT